MSDKKKAKPWWEDDSESKLPKARTGRKPRTDIAQVQTLGDLPPLYSIDQVAKYFDVSPWTIRDWRHNGDIIPETESPLRFTAQQIAACKEKKRKRKVANG